MATHETTFQAAEDRYQKLPYRRAGDSGLDLSAFSFGLWQKFGTDYPYENQREIVLHALNLGITPFDNANRYGPPHRAAEKFFGQVLAKDLASQRDELILSTKAGNPIGPSPHLTGTEAEARAREQELYATLPIEWLTTALPHTLGLPPGG